MESNTLNLQDVALSAQNSSDLMLCPICYSMMDDHSDNDGDGHCDHESPEQNPKERKTFGQFMF